MGGYFSFDRLITKSIVKLIYFVGFIILTTSGLSLIIWAGLQLHDANITRVLGWRYVAIGAAAVVVGNVIWRVFCVLWMVLFHIDAQLSALGPQATVTAEPFFANQIVERRQSHKDRKIANDRQEILPTLQREVNPSGSVLGLS